MKFLILTLLSIVLALGVYYYLYQSSPLSLLNNLTNGTHASLKVSTDASTEVPLILAHDGTVTLPNATLEVDLSRSLGTDSAIASQITDIDGLGGGATFISGVHIDAQESVLGTPGILTIDIPKDTDTTNLAGFSYAEDGKDYHLYPIEIIDGKAVFSINHFSGYGIVLLEPTFEDPPVSSYEARVKQMIMIEMLRMQREQIHGDGGDVASLHAAVYPEIWKWLTALDTEYATPATKDASLLHSAITEYVRFLQIVQLIGNSFDAEAQGEFDTKVQAVETKLIAAVKKANDTALAACREKKDPDQAALLMYLYSLASLTFSGDFDYLLDSARSCAQFTLRIETEVTEPDFVDGCDLVQNYRGEIPLTIDPEVSLALSGTGIVSGSATLCDRSCTVTQGSFDQPVIVPAVHIRTGSATDISFLIEVPEAEIPLAWSCTEEFQGGTMSVGHMYEWAFTLLDTKLPMLSPEHFILEDWDSVKKGDVYASQVYKGKVPGTEPYPLSIDTTYSLIHTPQP